MATDESALEKRLRKSENLSRAAMACFFALMALLAWNQWMLQEAASLILDLQERTERLECAIPRRQPGRVDRAVSLPAEPL